MASRALAAPAVCVLAGLASVTLAACGLGAGKAPSAIRLVVTRDFGSHTLPGDGALKVRGEETVMSLLMRNYAVATRYAGGFVESIDGLSGGREGASAVDWFYYVNGVEARRGAAQTNVEKGDHIWWDHHDWSQTEHVPAVVGSFPEPFLNGLDGKRLPVRVECASVGDYACTTVTARLRAAGVPAAIAALAPGAGGAETLRVLVGRWVDVEHDPAAASIAGGPRASGVYARYSSDGASLSLLDPSGGTARTLHADAGLIAAMRREEEAPTWVVSGTDARGVDSAAAAFSRATLAERFALAVDGSETLPVPLIAGAGGE